MVTEKFDCVTLIGLPYHCGVRGAVPGNAMATAPEILLAPEHVPDQLLHRSISHQITLLNNADQATDAEIGDDFRLIPAGDQMGRMLVQSIHTAAAVRTARTNNTLPVVCLGTCSGSLGVIGGLNAKENQFGVIWFDAHGDADTPETSRTGFIEGMVTSTIVGRCWSQYTAQTPGFAPIPEEHFISVSLHEFYSNPGPGDNLSVGTAVSKPVIDKLGFDRSMAAALDLLAPRVSSVYVHVDTDVLDPSVLKSNLHSAPGGLTVDQVNRGLQMIANQFEILAVSFSSWDPAVDPNGATIIAPMIANAAEAALGSHPRL